MPWVAPTYTPPQTWGGAYQPSAIEPTATGLGSRIKAAYNAASQRAGGRLTHADPTTLLIWQVLGGLTPQQAAVASARGAAYSNQYGRLLSDAEVEQLVTDVKTQQPARFTPAYGAGASIQKAYQDFRAQYPTELPTATDPRFLALVRNNPELADITSDQLGQILTAGRQFTGATGQLAGAGLDPMIGSVMGRYIPPPHQMSPQAYDAIHADPVKLGLWQGALQRAGWDVGTYEAQHKASRPVGTATPADGGTGGAWRAPAGVWS